MSTKYLCDCTHCLKFVNHSAVDRFCNLSVSPGWWLCCFQAVSVGRSLCFTSFGKRDVTFCQWIKMHGSIFIVCKDKNIVPLNMSLRSYLPMGLFILSGVGISDFFIQTHVILGCLALCWERFSHHAGLYLVQLACLDFSQWCNSKQRCVNNDWVMSNHHKANSHQISTNTNHLYACIFFLCKIQTLNYSSFYFFKDHFLMCLTLF